MKFLLLLTLLLPIGLLGTNTAVATPRAEIEHLLAHIVKKSAKAKQACI